MRLLSQVFQPLITIPKNAKIKSTEITSKSQKLLMECGLVRPTSSGLFAILPLARRALDKLEAHIRLHMEAAGFSRVSLPALTPSELWRRSGRLQTGAELMSLTDRHDKTYVLAPTHEEAIADLLADVSPLSYKQLPLLLYQISDKYRDEHRPKHGMLRARSFAMLDAYGAHGDRVCADTTYKRAARTYTRLFAELRLPVTPVSAPAGDMGGSLSHEWQLPCASGEDSLGSCRDCAAATLSGTEACARCGGPVDRVSSVEVGHTFLLGTEYSAALGARYTSRAGASEPVFMSCYGIGVTRLVAACVDHLSTEDNIRWPRLIAPYTAIVIGPKEGSKEWSNHGWDAIRNVHDSLSTVPGLTGDVLVDDRHGLTVGKRVMQADRMGYPFIVVCGRGTLESPARYELHTTTDKRRPPDMVTLCELAAAIDEKIREDGEIDDVERVGLGIDYFYKDTTTDKRRPTRC